MDVTEGFSQQITYAVDDLQNLDSKATAFSKTIVLPGSAKNNKLLGNIFEFANSNFTGAGENVGYNFNASRSAKCRLEINGLQIIKGVLRLLEIVRDGDSIEYEVAIFGELGGFFTSLGNKKLDDLDFSVYNHTYTIANIVNRFDDKPDWIFISPYYDNVVTPTFLQIYSYGNDISMWIKPGDTINVKHATLGTDYGNSTVVSISYNSGLSESQIYLSTALTGTPVTTIQVKITLVNKGGCGVYYPLIDYGTYSTDKDNYKYKTFRPALFVREYLHKIITGAGYTYESKFFETDFFKRLVIPHNESLLQTIKSDLFSGNFFNSYSQGPGSGVLTIDDDIQISQVYGDTFTTSDNKSWTYIGSNGDITISGILDMYIYTAVKSWSGYFEIRKNNVQAGTQHVISGNSGGANVRININDTISLVTNDVLTFHIYVTKPAQFPSDLLVINFSNNIKIASVYPVTAPIQLNDLVELSKAIPKNIMQKDFFASILKLFYLMVTEDKYKEKHLKIEPWTWFYNLDSDSYIDWSMKLDRSQPIRIRPMSEINSRYYELKYKSDTDYYNDLYKKRYNEGYGDRKFDNELEFAKDSQSTEVIFSSTPLVGYPNRDKIVPTILKWNGTYGGGGFPINEERVNSNIRIMQIKYIDEINDWDILADNGNTLATNTFYPYAGHLDDPDAPGSDINFGVTKELFFTLTSGALGNNLFNAFYSSYLAEITDKDSRLVIAKFKLNDTDIFNLDFGKFIYLDGVLYRLSKIVDYTPGEICTVELLRVIYTTYDNTVNASEDPEVIINNKTWKVKNLDIEFYQNGDPIPQITDETEWANATEGAWCYYENNSANGIEYGKLYNWYAVNDNRGLAPAGWTIPTEQDLIDLANYTNGSNELKEIGTTHWNQGNGTDEFGFKALGAGRRRYNGPFEQLKTFTYYWTRDEYDTDMAYYGRIQDTSDTFSTNKLDKNYGFSIRLIKQ